MAQCTDLIQHTLYNILLTFNKLQASWRMPLPEHSCTDAQKDGQPENITNASGANYRMSEA